MRGKEKGVLLTNTPEKNISILQGHFVSNTPEKKHINTAVLLIQLFN
jgi:hypothetical protein